MNSERLDKILQQIDAVNQKDPDTELVDGNPQGKTFLQCRRIYDWAVKLDPDASDCLRIAARGAHIARWTSPRESYDAGRIGYLKWREDLKKFHALEVCRIMETQGYTEADQEKVTAIIRKKSLKDADTQTLEDALCLEFMENGFTAFMRKTDESKLIDIIRKTWKKMSPRGREAALKLEWPERAKELVGKALANSE